jgi:VanZ family protein
MKKNIRIILVVIWMALIFYFSSMPAAVSSQKSDFVIKIFELLGLDLNSILGSMADFVVRKAGHFTEYFILFLLWFNVLFEKIKLRKAIGYSLAAVFLYACTDEFHQLFVPGRAGRFTDVLIDFSGGCLGAAVRYLKLRTKGMDFEELEEKDIKDE